MECKDVRPIMVIPSPYGFTQVSMGILPIGGAEALFPGHSSSDSRAIAEVTG